jgi:hypothetical protein
MIKILHRPESVDPDKLDSFLTHWVPRLGLESWEIIIEFSDLDSLGACHHNFYAQQVHIALNPDRAHQQTWGGDIYQTLYHELLHVTQAPFVKLLATIRDECIASRDHGWFDELVRQAAEQQVELLAKGLDHV